MNFTKALDDWGMRILNAVVPTNLRQKTSEFLDRVSDERLIVWDYKTVIFVLGSLMTYALFVSFNLSGTSIEKWEQYIPDSTKIASYQPIIGKAKWIRFDEWCLGVPCIRAVAANDFGRINPGVGYGESALLMGIPVRDVTTYVKPHLWGYFLFSFERGYSFFWYWKTFGLLISGFLLLKVLSRNNFWMSLAGSVWILFSSYVQWWFSTPGTDLMVAAFMICVSGLYVLLSRNTLAIVVNALILTIFSLSFFLTLYPPYQVSLGYLILAVLGGVAWKNYSKEIFHDKLWLRVACVVIMFAMIGGMMAHFLSACKDSIAIMAATEYPGNRISTGGVISLNKYLGGFFDFLYSESHLPPIWYNPCEASNFILLFPVVFIAMIIDKIKGKRVDAFDIVLLVYILFISTWVLVGYPEFIAKITALNRVRENRAFIGIGIGSILLVIHYLSGDRSARAHSSDSSDTTESTDAKSKKKKKQARATKSASLSSGLQSNLFNVGSLAIMVLSFGLMYWFGNYFNEENKNFLTTKQIFGVSFAVSVLSMLILSHARFLFSTIIVALVLWSNFMINPIAKGMPSLFDKDLMRVVTEIRKNDPDAKWIAYGSNILANYLIATGVNVISGTKFIPDLEMMKVFDPTLAKKSVYNRFAHVHCLPFNPDSKNPNDIKFIIDNEDAYTLCVSPRSEQLAKIGVKYIMSNRTSLKEDLEMWEPLFDDQINGMYLYKRREGKRYPSEEFLSKLRELPAAQFRVEHLNVAANTSHDRFIVTGWAYNMQENCPASTIFADVNGHLVKATVGINDPAAPEERFRSGGFRIEIPYTRLGTGSSEFRLKVLNKDGSGYATAPTPLGVQLN